jgi:hypothetical protein
VSVFRARLLASTCSVGILLAASSSGHAQDTMRAEGAKACGPDATRLCSHVLEQGDMVMLKCFQNRRTKLAPGCRAFLTKAGQLK